MKNFCLKLTSVFQFLVLTMVFMAMTASSKAYALEEMTDFSQITPLKAFAEQVKVTYKVVSNQQDDDCQALFKGPCFAGEISFSLDRKQEFTAFNLFFSHIAPIKWDNHPQLDIVHVNGDLHKIHFSGDEFTSGDLTLAFNAAFWHANHSDAMPNYFVVSASEGPYIVDSTRVLTDSNTGLQQAAQLIPHMSPEQKMRHKDDRLPYADAAWMFEHYKTWQIKASQETEVHRIIPNIKASQWSANQYLDLSSGIHLHWQKGETSHAVKTLFNDAGIGLNKEGIDVTIKADVELSAEGYLIEVKPSGIEISASGQLGANYALVSLYQLAKTHNKLIPYGTAKDEPRYGFRGVHVDLARNFLGKDVILNLIEQMFLLKLNKLHLHLADDEGWRLDIPAIPELTQVGAWRCFELESNLEPDEESSLEPIEENCLLPQLGSGPFKDSPTNGFLTVDDYLQILTVAHERHIEVIPSFDLPGHARAAIKAMEARYRKYKGLENTKKAEQYLLSDFKDDTPYSSVQFYNDNTVNPCMESTYRFINEVIGTVKSMHKTVSAPLTTYHIGADETAGAWVNSPVCKSLIEKQEALNDVSDLKPMFLNRVIEIIEAHGLKAAGWSDGMHKILKSEAGQGHQVNVWDTLFWSGHNIAQEFTENGWSTVLSHPDVLYFDFPYSNHADEHGYYWASKNTDEFKVFQFMPENQGANALQWLDRFGHPYESTVRLEKSELEVPFKYTGLQTQIWTESVRNVATFEYLMYPRLQVFAERAWHKADWEIPLQNANYKYGKAGDLLAKQYTDWQSFESSLLRYLQQGLIGSSNYRLPPPGAVLINGLLQVNTAWSGIEVECRFDGQLWQLVKSETRVPANAASVVCRSRMLGFDNTRYSREVTVVNTTTL